MVIQRKEAERLRKEAEKVAKINDISKISFILIIETKTNTAQYPKRRIKNDSNETFISFACKKYIK